MLNALCRTLVLRVIRKQDCCYQQAEVASLSYTEATTNTCHLGIHLYFHLALTALQVFYNTKNAFNLERSFWVGTSCSLLVSEHNMFPNTRSYLGSVSQSFPLPKIPGRHTISNTCLLPRPQERHGVITCQGPSQAPSVPQCDPTLRAIR